MVSGADIILEKLRKNAELASFSCDVVFESKETKLFYTDQCMSEDLTVFFNVIAVNLKVQRGKQQ